MEAEKEKNKSFLARKTVGILYRVIKNSLFT
jgi:hypothetical protein